MTQEPLADSNETAAALTRWMETFQERSWHDWMRHVKSSGLSMPQFGAMMHLYHRGSCGVSDVGGHMEITSAAASQLVDRLVHQGLVERKEDPRDRRVRTLSLTQSGRALVESGMKESYRWLEERVSGLSEEKRKAIAAALPALIEAGREAEIHHA
jgi:DNA-binding MarR family transcriptional regulator